MYFCLKENTMKHRKTINIYQNINSGLLWIGRYCRWFLIFLSVLFFYLRIHMITLCFKNVTLKMRKWLSSCLIFFFDILYEVLFPFLQGCIFTIQVRTKKDGHFRRLGNPEGRPNAGRSVGQCDASPCSLMTCGNGGTCIDSGSTA